ncbi:MAG TPA: hypothetical protein DEH25_06460 [Chloroflexi bacterium]|nr:hypothetical protein [Chloroflexota bacterium]HBY07225.1 hypothetical protein [Chloroflexota bacterium]
MIKKKAYDGVVVAVHYKPQGEIDWVRAFERHGFVFSDRVMLGREALVQRLKDGKRFKTGARKTYEGNDFEVREDIRLIDKNGSSVIVAGPAASERDALIGVPII